MPNAHLPMMAQAISLFLQSMRGVKSPATVHWYERRLQPLSAAFARRRIDNLTVDDLRAWRAELSQRAMSPWTLHGYVRAAKRLFAWLVEEGRLTLSPAERLELPSLPLEPARGISDDDRRRMLDAAKDHPRDYALLLFLADTGARIGGVAGLTIEKLDLRSGRAEVLEKGSKARTLYIQPPTRRALRAYLGGRTTGPVFLDRWGRAGLTTWGLRLIVKRWGEKVGASGRYNPHAWRHGAARSWLKRGANLAQVAQLLGHSDVSVTVKFYGAFVDEELRQAHRRFSVVQDDETE